MSTLIQLNSIFQEVFDNPDLSVDDATSADDIAGWDSVGQVKLVLAIEESFAIRFTGDEVSSLHSAGDFLDAVEQRKGAVR